MLNYRKYIGAVLLTGLVAGCSTAPRSESGKLNLETDVDNTLKRLYVSHPWLEAFVNGSAGHVVFPSVGKGGLIVGGAYGRGVVFEKGVQVGFSDVSQATVGAQVGGQEFSEIITFENKADLERFKQGKFTFAKQVSYVALKSGEAKSGKYTDGVAVFVAPVAGLMAEASIGGQSFTFQPQ